MISINRKGCTRDCILTKNYAVKIPSLASDWRHFLQGMLANDREVRLSASNDFVDNEHFNPVLFSLPFGLLTIQKRAVPLNFEDWTIYNEEIRSMSKDWLLSEQKMDSYGWVDGILMIIDYGN